METKEQPSQWLINNIHFFYDRDSPDNNDNEKKQHFLQHKNTKEAYTYGSKSIGRKIGFAVVFTDITRRGFQY